MAYWVQGLSEQVGIGEAENIKNGDVRIRKYSKKGWQTIHRDLIDDDTLWKDYLPSAVGLGI